MKDPNWRRCILRADSRNVIKRIPDNSIDFILTDPPYNIGKHSRGNIPLPGRSAINNDVAEWDWVDFYPEEWTDELIRILKPTGNLFIFTSYNQIGRWYNCLDHRFDTTNFMVWHKTNPAPKIFRAGFLNSCEMIFTCWNKKHKWNFISQSEMHNFIESPICMRPERLSCPKHPAQKPVSILKKMIEIATDKNDIVFDPFMGVGSTGVAALELGRRFIGIEINDTYFEAAKNRIYNIMIEESIHPTEGMVSDVNIVRQTSLFDLKDFFREENTDMKKKSVAEHTGLQPILKWAGGKEKELKYILPNIPTFNRFFEPFVGGGSVFMAIRAKEYYINDLSSELISLYRYISASDSTFIKYAYAIDETWSNAERFFIEHEELVDLYKEFRNDKISKTELKENIVTFCRENVEGISNINTEELKGLPCILSEEMEKNLFRKMSRMKELEIKKNRLPEQDLHDNVETAVKSTVYMNFRYLYNNREIESGNNALHCALFLFIRNYSYSGMFRYNDDGDFNVPYGGIGYNRKGMARKLDYYQSQPLIGHFANAHIYNNDFEDFLRNCNPSKDDFVFLDPPYDSEFSTYAKNAFTREDHQRLADYMLNKCRAKWMMIIKNTDFIFNLYNKDNINIRTFDKDYIVSFMNRNEKKVTHLLITNY